MRCKWDIRTAKLPPIDREAYTNAAVFLNRMKHHRGALTYMQWKTLCEKALAGHVDEAEAELLQILRKGEDGS